MVSFQENSIKVAFAEGYLAAANSEDHPKSGKTMKYLKVSFHIFPTKKEIPTHKTLRQVMPEIKHPGFSAIVSYCRIYWNICKSVLLIEWFHVSVS